MSLKLTFNLFELWTSWRSCCCVTMITPWRLRALSCNITEMFSFVWPFWTLKLAQGQDSLWMKLHALCYKYITLQGWVFLYRGVLHMNISFKMERCLLLTVGYFHNFNWFLGGRQKKHNVVYKSGFPQVKKRPGKNIFFKSQEKSGNLEFCQSQEKVRKNYINPLAHVFDQDGTYKRFITWLHGHLRGIDCYISLTKMQESIGNVSLITFYVFFFNNCLHIIW